LLRDGAIEHGAEYSPDHDCDRYHNRTCHLSSDRSRT
jgi:hypothetical protein